MLYMLGQRELARCVFPVGELTKADVRAHAARLGLRTADKPESMDVCFVKKGGRVEFLDRTRADAPGTVVDSTGAVLGVTQGSRRSRSVSGVAWALPRANGATSSTSTRPPRRSRSGRAPTVARRSRGARPHVRRRRARRAHRCSRRYARTASRPRARLDGNVVRFARRAAARRARSGRRALRRRRARRRWHRSLSPLRATARGCAATAARRSMSSRRTTAIRRASVLNRLRRLADRGPARNELRGLVEAATTTEPSVAPRRRSRTAGAGTDAASTACMPMMRSRTNSTGSASVIGSTTTNPAGTSTAHRRERPMRAARTSTTTSGTPTASATKPSTMRPSARSNGAAITPPHDERAREGKRREEQRRRDAERDALLVAVRERVHGRDRDVVTRREHCA